MLLTDAYYIRKFDFFFRAGSLVVEYSVQVPNVQQVCADVSREECLQKVSTSVKEVSASEPIQTSDMRGTIDEKRTIVSGKYI